MDQKPLLFSYCLSSCAWRVRLVLQLKQIEYETKVMSLKPTYSQEEIDDYSKINPLLMVPALIIDGHTLIESVAIMHYLEETRPQCPLLPKDPVKRAKVREIVEIICASIQPMQNTAILKKLPQGERVEWCQHYITRGYAAIEKLLSVSSGKYAVGDEITLADCCLIPQTYNALRRFEMDLTDFPNILRIYKELETHPAFQATHPTAQSDYSEQLFLSIKAP